MEITAHMHSLLLCNAMNLINVKLTYDERYEFIKLYDILRDMNFELSDKQQSVFEKIQEES